MSNVIIKKGLYRGKEIAGTFPLISTWFPTEVPDDSKHMGDGKVIVRLNGANKGIWVFHDDFEYTDVPETFGEVITPEESDADMILRIRRRFSVMDIMSSGIIQGNIRSLIISGAAGIGKTYTLNASLKQAESDGAITYNMINGKISAIGLYVRLWEARDESSVLMIDDVDVFSDMDTLNILKAALDTGETRKVCWSTASSYLEDLDIPREFDFMGTVVFITNVDIDRELQRETKLSPHINALVSRSVYLDLGVHTNREIMTRVSDVIISTNMLQDKGLNSAEVVEVLEWMKDNCDNLRNVSLRTALYIGDFVNTDSDNWKMIAETTMLKKI